MTVNVFAGSALLRRQNVQPEKSLPLKSLMRSVGATGAGASAAKMFGVNVSDRNKHATATMVARVEFFVAKVSRRPNRTSRMQAHDKSACLSLANVVTMLSNQLLLRPVYFTTTGNCLSFLQLNQFFLG